MPAQAPIACTKRQAIMAPTLVESAQPTEPKHENGDARRHRRPAPVFVAERTPDQLSDAATDEITGNRPFHRAGSAAQSARHRRQSREIKVGRKRAEGHQRAQDS